MQKMMTYSEANSVLGSSLTPANRCLSKAVAIANDANPDLLVNFDNARLVPASVIEQNSHWLDEHTITHIFVDENGNQIGDGKTLNVVLPEHGSIILIRTKALLDGQPFPDYMKGGSSYADEQHPMDPYWIHNEGCISEEGYNVYSDYQPTDEDAGMIDRVGTYDTSFWPRESSPGITTHIVECPVNYRYANVPGHTVFSIIINDDFARPLNINRPDTVNNWNIQLNVNRQSLPYDINYSSYSFSDRDQIGQESFDFFLTGFGSNRSDYTIQYVGWSCGGLFEFFEYNESGKVTEIVPQYGEDSFTVKRTGDAAVLPGHEYKSKTLNLYKIYKNSDPSIYVYLAVICHPLK